MSDTTPATLSPEELEAIRQRHAKATPGKWYYVASMTPEEAGVPNGAAADVVREVVPADDDGPAETESIISEMRDRDFEFMAESRQDVPALLADVAERTRELEAARATLALSTAPGTKMPKGVATSFERLGGVSSNPGDAKNVVFERITGLRFEPPSPPAETGNILDEARAGLEFALVSGCGCSRKFICAGHAALRIVKDALSAAPGTPSPASGVAEPDSALNTIGEMLGIGSATRDLSTIRANIGNLQRRAACLNAVEREFFTREVPVDDDDDDTPGRECVLGWGAEPGNYVEQFRAALAAPTPPSPPPGTESPAAKPRRISFKELHESPRSWPDRKYLCNCRWCLEPFIGHKQQSVCKLCENPPGVATPTPAAATPAPAGGKLRNATPEEIEQQRQGYAAATVAEQLDPTARHTIPARQDAAAEKETKP